MNKHNELTNRLADAMVATATPGAALYKAGSLSRWFDLAAWKHRERMNGRGFENLLEAVRFAQDMAGNPETLTDEGREASVRDAAGRELYHCCLNGWSWDVEGESFAYDHTGYHGDPENNERGYWHDFDETFSEYPIEDESDLRVHRVECTVWTVSEWANRAKDGNEVLYRDCESDDSENGEFTDPDKICGLIAAQN